MHKEKKEKNLTVHLTTTSVTGRGVGVATAAHPPERSELPPPDGSLPTATLPEEHAAAVAYRGSQPLLRCKRLLPGKRKEKER